MKEVANEIETLHSLDFEVAPWECMGSIDENFIKFRIGTCEGLWQHTATSFDILAITNDLPGNGHFEDVLQWFEHSCKRDQKDFRILEVWNLDFKKHLLTKRKFKPQGMDNVIKRFKDIKP